MAEWKLLRDKEDLEDDLALEEIDLPVEISVQSNQGPSYLDPHRLVSTSLSKVAVVFRDNNGAYVYGDRGSFNMQFVELVSTVDEGDTSTVLEGDEFPFVIDSVLLEAGIGFRSMHAPPGSEDASFATVRLQDIVAPAGATNIRILYKEG
jgi:hypothetical protein